MILADTSIWVDHFRAANSKLHALIANGRVLMHPFVIAEVALGFLSQRRLKLMLMEKLLQVKVADTVEVRRMIEAHTLFSRGIGFVDAHLLASCLLTPGTRLWTRDARLAGTARLLKCEAQIPEPRPIN
ncbi:MAG TPA: type II toxin-antitoxin system VapC family toxin [Acidobacteriaceae bacterium]|nr:type II toxin-antitoxin system VapC family toxin [Acidobacteriaceae bacterium]